MILEKIKNDLVLSIDNTTSPTSIEGDNDLQSLSSNMTKEEENATDAVLDYLIQTGARPQIDVNGDIIEIVTSIVNILNEHVPNHLSHPLKVMTDYIARWLCDYFEQTNANQIKVSFGFNAVIPVKDGE